MAKRKVTVQKASVERPGDVGIDLPAGATAGELRPADYHPVEMEEAEHPVRPVKVSAAVVERGGDVGLDLPAGATAAELRPADYHPVEMEPAEPQKAPKKHGRRAHR